MTKQAYLQQDGMFMKLTTAKAKFIECMDQLQQPWKIEYHVKNLPGIFYSKSRARLRQAMALHNCKR